MSQLPTELSADASDEPQPACIEVEHITHYDYASPVELAHHLAYLHLRDDDLQELQAFELQIQPQPAQHRSEQDAYGNQRECFSLTSPHQSLTVSARSRVKVLPRHRQLIGQAGLPWEAVRERLAFHAAAAYEPASEFSFPSPFVPLLAELRAYARVSFQPGRMLTDASIELMQRIHHDFDYQPTSTEVSTPVLEAFEQRCGVCQDFAHVMIGCLRSLGLAASYISGYLLTQSAPGEPRLVGADASHAWLAVWCPLQRASADDDVAVDAPDLGAMPDASQRSALWLELDPTNNCLADTRHVRLAHGRDYGDVTPLRGVIRGGNKHTLSVNVTTQALR